MSALSSVIATQGLRVCLQTPRCLLFRGGGAGRQGEEPEH